MTTATLHPAALALGLPGLSFRVLCASTLAYVLALLLLVPQSGAVGASFAYVGFYIVWTALMVWAVRSSLSERVSPHE